MLSQSQLVWKTKRLNGIAITKHIRPRCFVKHTYCAFLQKRAPTSTFQLKSSRTRDATRNAAGRRHTREATAKIDKRGCRAGEGGVVRESHNYSADSLDTRTEQRASQLTANSLFHWTTFTAFQQANLPRELRPQMPWRRFWLVINILLFSLGRFPGGFGMHVRKAWLSKKTRRAFSSC